ncbi:hypothetical protein BDQ17DRAFT_1414609 [Cyathus striatus]|nr:hypothetical protein BDQ17DRAFT_1414609 [Cyathus striatus]
MSTHTLSGELGQEETVLESPLSRTFANDAANMSTRTLHSTASVHRKKVEPMPSSGSLGKEAVPPVPPVPTPAAPPRPPAHKIYIKVLLPATIIAVFLIFAILAIFWGSLWKIPAYQLPGVIVDFDGGEVGQTITEEIMALSRGPIRLLKHDRSWAAIAINAGATDRLTYSLTNRNATYDGTDAITGMAVEARNENAFRALLRPTIQNSLENVTRQYATSIAGLIVNSNITVLAQVSPQTIVAPVSYKFLNISPFDTPVANALTFVGLIFQLILSSYVVVAAAMARGASGYQGKLSFWRLIGLRYLTSFTAYFFISFFFCLLSLAFKVNFSRHYGHAGFVIYWMLNYLLMLTLGLAIEAVFTILTPKYIAYFIISWIIVNISVTIWPPEVLPSIYRYGYAAPFYNLSKGVRSILFGTRNQLGLNVGVLLAWIGVSLITIPLFTWIMRRQAQCAARK